MLRPLAAAFGFLTRIPVGRGAVEPRELGRAVAWFPAVGAALGAAQLAGHRALDGALAPGLVAVALVALHAALTGGLHLDGVADVFDALGGGRGQRDRMLAIMRDSRIGAHGAVAVALLLAAKAAAIAALLDRSSGHHAGWALYAAPIAARWAAVPLVVAFPYARPDGLGRAFHDHAGAAQLLGATAISALAVGWIGAPAVGPWLAAAGAAVAIAVWLHRHLGGLTGDVYGAAIEAAELAFLVAAGLRG
ncbi:MAG TPA: adenosylcobinamide-GDP ribazoletransferase [Kofleriaceae bacterium]|nr:adenosylcobinamide-GDP ribazoletransferase [Kofleriaceae bacterium]